MPAGDPTSRVNFSNPFEGLATYPRPTGKPDGGPRGFPQTYNRRMRYTTLSLESAARCARPLLGSERHRRAAVTGRRAAHWPALEAPSLLAKQHTLGSDGHNPKPFTKFSGDASSYALDRPATLGAARPDKAPESPRQGQCRKTRGSACPQPEAEIDLGLFANRVASVAPSTPCPRYMPVKRNISTELPCLPRSTLVDGGHALATSSN